MTSKTLVLNASYQPLQVVTWKRAIRMLILEKADVLAAYDREIRSVSLSLQLPAVLKLKTYVRIHRYPLPIKFNRANIFLRDRYACQYCGETLPTDSLTCDHVLPVSRGGGRSWENIVTCCIPCNREKGNRTPEESGFQLLRKPKGPSGFSQRISLLLRQAQPPESWHDYLFQ